MPLFSIPAFSYEAIWPATKPGTTEVKSLPERTALETSTTGQYFKNDDGMFMRLFRYIDGNEVKMTVPVTADIEPGRMRFFVGKDAPNTLKDTKNVSVVKLPEQMVVSTGLRGGYSEARFKKGRARLDEWLKANPDYEATGPAYGVYWNGPFVPGAFKKSEVHIPVRKKMATTTP